MFVTVVFVPFDHKHRYCIVVICKFSTTHRPALEPTLYSAGTLILCRGIKRTEREPENSFPSSSETEIGYMRICKYQTSVLREVKQRGSHVFLTCLSVRYRMQPWMRWKTECNWIVDKYLPVDTAKYSRRLICTTKIWIMTEISCHNKVTTPIPQPPLANRRLHFPQTPAALLSVHFLTDCDLSTFENV